MDECGMSVSGVMWVKDGEDSVFEASFRTGKSSLAMSRIRKYPAAKKASEWLQTVLLNVRNDGVDVRVVCLEAGGEHQFSRRAKNSVDQPSDALEGLADSALMAVAFAGHEVGLT